MPNEPEIEVDETIAAAIHRGIQPPTTVKSFPATKSATSSASGILEFPKPK